MKLLPLLSQVLHDERKIAKYEASHAQAATYRDRLDADGWRHGFTQQMLEALSLLFEGLLKRVPDTEWSDADEAAFCSKHGFELQPLEVAV